MAQQTDKQIDAGVPMPDTSLVPPPTIKDIAVTPAPPTNDAVTPTVAAPAPIATAAAGDSAASHRLREMIAGKQLDRVVTRRADREVVDSYYKAHNYAPLWIAAGVANARAKSAIDYPGQVDAGG